MDAAQIEAIMARLSAPPDLEDSEAREIITALIKENSTPDGYDYFCKECKGNVTPCYIFDASAEFQPEYCPFDGHKLDQAMGVNPEDVEATT